MTYCNRSMLTDTSTFDVVKILINFYIFFTHHCDFFKNELFIVHQEYGINKSCDFFFHLNFISSNDYT